MVIWTSFIGQSFHPVGGRGWGKEGGLGYLYFSQVLLEYIKTWCNIQVIIYRLFKENEEADAAEKNEIEQLEQTRQQMKALQSWYGQPTLLNIIKLGCFHTKCLLSTNNPHPLNIIFFFIESLFRFRLKNFFNVTSLWCVLYVYVQNNCLIIAWMAYKTEEGLFYLSSSVKYKNYHPLSYPLRLKKILKLCSYM